MYRKTLFNKYEKTVGVNTTENNQLSESEAYKLQVNHQLTFEFAPHYHLNTTDNY